jgi:tRNA A-37 threonylcarbamoyl transferase component Bud32
VRFQNYDIACLISDFVEGHLLSDILQRAKGQRLPVFEAVNLLHAMIVGVEKIHAVGEYHGDLHTDNVFVQKFGVGFNVKLIDLFHHQDTKLQNMQFDIYNLIKIFYDVLGGPKHYQQQPPQVKGIVCGLRKDLINKKFRTIAKLRQYVEKIEWDM